MIALTFPNAFAHLPVPTPWILAVQWKDVCRVHVLVISSCAGNKLTVMFTMAGVLGNRGRLFNLLACLALIVTGYLGVLVANRPPVLVARLDVLFLNTSLPLLVAARLHDVAHERLVFTLILFRKRRPLGRRCTTLPHPLVVKDKRRGQRLRGLELMRSWSLSSASICRSQGTLDRGIWCSFARYM